jgi:hypothetical protein
MFDLWLRISAIRHEHSKGMSFDRRNQGMATSWPDVRELETGLREPSWRKESGSRPEIWSSN